MPHRKSTYPGEIYHIFNRGVDKRKIFLDEQDYLRFILSLYILNDKNNKYDVWSSLKFNKNETLAILSTTGLPEGPVVTKDKRDCLVDILAFTSMSNHYHLIIREKIPNGIALFMQKFGGGYAQYFNGQYKRSGTLFESRYQAVRVKSDVQLAHLFNYVHTNQIEIVELGWKTAGVQDERRALSQLKTYPWTSYHDYVGDIKFPRITERDFYLDLFDGTNGCRQSVEDWVKFKAQNADLPDHLKKLQNYDIASLVSRTKTIESSGDPVVSSV